MNLKAGALGLLKFVALLTFLYFFICSLTFLTDAFRLIAGRTAGSVFSGDLLSNPIVGLMIGVLFTVLVQSSSTCTTVVVSMVASELINVRIAIPMIMGANIGTSMTSTIVSLTHITDRDQYERAFASATVHDCFNWLSVIIFLTIELLTGYLYQFSGWLIEKAYGVNPNDELINELTHNITSTAHKIPKVNLLKAITKPFTKKIMQLDKKVLTCWGQGGCTEDHYRLLKYDCSKSQQILQDGSHNNVTEYCHFLFNLPNLSDSTLGVIFMVLSLIMLTVCLVLIVKTLQSLLQGAVSKMLQKFINADIPYVPWVTGYLAIIVGAILTFIVQSSSVFTSAITPMVGVGLITVDRVYPLTLGSNIGTTTTALLAALASGKLTSMQIALCHLIFNLSGILVFYPIPFLRLPLFMCKRLGKITAKYRWFAVFYLFIMFFVVPGGVLGLSVAGQTPLIVVLAILGVGIGGGGILVLLVNLLQAKKPHWLPTKMQTWDFLPLWMRSLQPLDRLVTALTKICCICKRRGLDSKTKPTEMNMTKEKTGNVNRGLENDEGLDITTPV